MNQLRTALLLKIWITIVLWCAPLLLFPVSLFEWIGFGDIGSIVLIKLLGMAYAALVVGYYFGYRELLSGSYPTNTVSVGIVSNLGAFLILLGSERSGAWDSWQLMAKVFMWFSIFATGAISLSLYIFGPKKYGFSPTKII